MKTHLASLDGLRGVAALAVVGSHFENLTGYDLHLRAAGAAVDFFFILSGFVIAQAYEARLGEDLSWGGYMALRLRRLYPAILAGILAGLAVAAWAGEPIHPWLAAQFLLLPVLWGPVVHGGEVFPLNGPQWSLLLELAINAAHAAAVRWLTIPVLAILVGLSGLSLVYVALHFGSLDVGWSRTNLWGGPPRVIFGFGMGLLLFRLRARGWTAPRVPYPLIALMLGACMFRWFPDLGLIAERDIVKVLVVLPILVALAIASPVPARLAPLAAGLGALSYPLYAIHTPLLRACETGLHQLFDDPPAWAWWTGLALTLALAWAFERFYDAPVRAWLRRSAHQGGRRA